MMFSLLFYSMDELRGASSDYGPWRMRSKKHVAVSMEEDRTLKAAPAGSSSNMRCLEENPILRCRKDGNTAEVVGHYFMSAGDVIGNVLLPLVSKNPDVMNYVKLERSI